MGLDTMTRHANPHHIQDWQSEYTASISDTELAVMTLLIEGYSAREIAQKSLHSEFVVQAAMASVLKMTRSKNLVNAAIKLIRSGALTI